MRALLINPYDETITELDVGKHPELYSLLTEPGKQGVGTADMIRLTPTDALYVDDEGHCRAGHMCWTLEGYPTPLAGRGLILGHDAKGDYASASGAITLEKLKRIVSWLRMVSTGTFHAATEGYVEHPIFGRVWQITQGGPKLAYPEDL